MEKSLSGLKAAVLLMISFFIVLFGIILTKAPTPIVLMAAGAVVIALSLIWGVKWEDIEKDLLDSLRSMFIPILILLSVGMLIGAWMISGTIPVMIYYGLLILKPSFFLIVTAIVCSIMSVMAGTSWGTIGTLGVAFMAVSAGLGIPPAYTAGAIVVGAMFGDKMSPLSDTTVMASGVINVKIVDHIKHMLYTTIPGYLISLLLYSVLGFQFGSQTLNTEKVAVILSTLGQTFNLNPVIMLPPIVVLFLIFRRKPVLPVFGVGIFMGCLLALLFQDRSMLQIAEALNSGYTDSTNIPMVDDMLHQGGLSGMLDTMVLLIAAAIFGSPLRTAGVFQTIVETVTRFARQAKTMMTSALSLHAIFFMVTGSYYVTFAVLGPILAPLYDRHKLDRKNLSRTMEDTGTTFAPIIPWGVTGAYIAGTLNTPTVDYILFAPMTYLGIVFAVIYIFTGIGIAKTETTSKAAIKKSETTTGV
ncbi:NhaC family Na+:H+ antiporter [Scopulibacillus darangshiensis]|uniref:NhaC family Na+:H+ antiporter n=1 Tax=Scopulibacillus darangshiensis TaxID=442528 RepID=A0A4V2SMW5_9BACL|nr:Na+/H+ antiporter NhaC [Scopulibacillus darangshiensis]TCP28886.1 NhaC family Na+:H+ antiporter [Scopulibacillus darangshiensis]